MWIFADVFADLGNSDDVDGDCILTRLASRGPEDSDAAPDSGMATVSVLNLTPLADGLQ